MYKHFTFLIAILFACVFMPTRAQRVLLNFDEGWKFHLGNAADPSKDFGCGTEYFNYLTKANSIHNNGPYSNKFDDKDWKPVDLPHDFVVDLPFDSVASHSHGYKAVGYKFPENSVGWYRKTFHLDKEDQGKHIELIFDGIFRACRVWVNGFYCGGEESGYLSQEYDITDYLKFGEDNVVCVRTDATMEEGWFYEGGGIYRHVKMLKANAVHIPTNGISVRVKFSNNNFNKAAITFKGSVQNCSDVPVQCKMQYFVYDAEGNEVLAVEGADRENAIVSARKLADSGAFKYDVTLEDPHLWTPTDPYLYTCVSKLLVDDKVVDSVCTKFGCRQVKFNKKNGFLINNVRTRLKGVNMHQDHAGVGSGIPDAVLLWRMRQLKNMGCNAYRSAHNPMTPALLDICDSLGILVIDENRLSGTSEYQLKCLEKMIVRDRNHPSIILWSLGNEEWGLEWDERGKRIAAAMRNYCRLLDTTRPITFATSGGPTVEDPVDVAGYNYILQNPIDSLHQAFPERKCYGSEETSGCGTRGIYYDDPEGRWMKALNRAPNGPDSIYNCIERGWQFYVARQWASGCFFWTGFDYRGEPNPLKFPATTSQFGIHDYCGFPKDEAYYLKSWWTYDNTLHIFPHWNLKGHEGDTISVWAYSNCEQVQLIVNGKELEKKYVPQNGHLEWECVYEPGEVKAVGYKFGKPVMEEIIQTTDEASVVDVTADRTEINADGADVSIVTVCLKDDKGRVVPDACNQLVLNTEGNVKILGVGNGDPACLDPERPADINSHEFKVKAFNGYAQVLIQSQKTAGKASLTVSGEGLKAGKLALLLK